MTPHGERAGVLRLIAVFKFLKVLLLVTVGLGALKLLDPAAAADAREWLRGLAMSSDRRAMQGALVLVSRLTPERLEALGIGAFLYAALFTTEGIGLWLEKRWAEYLTVIATGSFVPFELYELARRPGLPRIAALVLNLAVVAYLIYHLRQPRT
ncbi:MAG TPA: DUF2127 domain-containing protein [Gemmatimonadales bacterium]